MNHYLTANFEKRFSGGPLVRLDDCRIPLDNRVTVLFGASGSGKTTILRCLAGLERPDRGHIHFKQEVWNDAAAGVFLPARMRHIGLAPQDHALFPHLNVEDNIAYGLRSLGPVERKARILELTGWLGLEDLCKRKPAELSGGQQQRVALARALAPRPRFLLLDEPLSALDQPTRVRLRRELRGLLQAARVPALLVTHDRQEAAALGDEIIVMHDGRMIQQGPVADVLSKPVSPDVAGILAVETLVPGEVVHLAEGIATVNVNGVSLQAIAHDLPASVRYVLVCIRAEDVSLSPDSHGTSSPRNRLPGRITGCFREGPLFRVELDCGFTLSALLTARSGDELHLAPGVTMTAMIKAPHIHLIARTEDLHDK